MRQIVVSRSGWCLLLAFAACCLLPACGSQRRSTVEATAWPALELDPRETGQGSGNWPGWRGYDGSGVAPGGDPPIRFSADEGYRWVADISGEGNASPIVWDDAVYLVSSVEADAEHRLVLSCFDRSDGSVRWQADVAPVGGPTHGKNGLASSTPITDGGAIYVFSGQVLAGPEKTPSGGMVAFDLEGNLLWETALGPMEHMWGIAASPILYENLVIQVCDSSEHSFVVALDRETGKEVWRTPRGSDGTWSTPLVVTAESDSGPRDELVINGAGMSGSDARSIIAYEPRSGEELWRVEGTEIYVTPTPLESGGLVYCTSGRNGPITAIRPGGSGNVTGSRVIWELTRGGPYIPSGLVYRNRLYLLSDHRSVACYNAGDGHLVWKESIGGNYSASLVAAAGRIYAIDERGTMTVFAAADEYRELARNEFDQRVLATPALAGDELFLRTEGRLYCFGKAP